MPLARFAATLLPMRRLALLAVVWTGLLVVPGALAASPTVRLALIHAVSGCHIWGTVDSSPLGATHTVKLVHGGKVQIRVSCPMAFTVTQLAGPKVALGAMPWQTGTAHTLVFTKPGIYKIQAVNVQSSAEAGLQTLGADNKPILIVRVR